MPDVIHGWPGGSRIVFRSREKPGFNGLDYCPESDPGGRLGEDVSAGLASFADHDISALEFIEDLDEKTGRDILPLGNILKLYDCVTIIMPGKADRSPTGILQFLGNPHR